MIEFKNNEVFLVTGASGGIGNAITKQIVDLGGFVVAVGRNESKLVEIQTYNIDRIAYVTKDLSKDFDSFQVWFANLVESYGRFSGIVLASGVQETKPLSLIKHDVLHSIFDTNFHSNLFIIKSFIKKQNRTGHNNSIVAISSLASQCGIPGITAYSASKGALNSAVKSLAIELSKEGIRINALLPGHIKTNMLTNNNKFFSQEYLEKLEAKYPLGLGLPEDVAGFTCFLLSNSARWITGANYVIDGGAGILF